MKITEILNRHAMHDCNICCCIIQREIVAIPAGQSTGNGRNNTERGVNTETTPTDMHCY